MCTLRALLPFLRFGLLALLSFVFFVLLTDRQRVSMQQELHHTACPLIHTCDCSALSERLRLARPSLSCPFLNGMHVRVVLLDWDRRVEEFL